MSTAPVPPYPVIIVNVRPDGSAHLNVAGRHVDFEQAPIEDTRRAVTAYGTELADALRRPVRMRTMDPEGEWLVAVHPNGSVTELPPAEEGPRRPRKQPAAPRLPAVATPPPPQSDSSESPTSPRRVFQPWARIPDPRPRTAPKVPLEHDPDATEFAQRPAWGASSAILTFGPGTQACVTTSALIGRRPVAGAREEAAMLVLIDDDARSISRTHLRVDWHDNRLWATDLASSNGTRVERSGERTHELVPWQPFELLHGDIAELGDVRVTVSLTTTATEKLA
ncbi:FHA domain-containing protein [Micromonospora sp. DT81.3]|uniref:FHA domain-containing protein n=1 Tax=Micromonospora sp. DT81.3 TaxID=3416523 RepID=UPI003CF4E270